MKTAVTFLAVATLLAGAPAVAQEAPSPVTASTQQADELGEIIVLARRSGAPMWTVTKGDSTLILVGAITGLPRDLEWRPDDLEAAAARSDLILTPQVGRASITDVLRVLWRIRTIARMPQGQTSADYLTLEWQTRLDAVMAGERNQDWREKSLLILGFDLMKDKAGYTGRGGRDDALDVIERAGRRARVDIRPVGTVRGDELIDSLITAPQSSHVACVQAAVAAAEIGPDAARQRAEAWRALRVPEVIDSPLDKALAQCWPWGDPEIAPQLHSQWAAAIETALFSPGVTMGVAPVRLLAEEGGVLDDLEARGFEIDGPEWK
ncbi:TraB/GumN family protein [Brevundimonas sp. Root1279]|uniref:TraB/GumN family protein n=1 Tax=Brevundimonas sp. Root1279 TaxID=1736443 RepID=UPI0006F38189|nr:TraB/GumN family protein [Brevundimonas sp. Root1279]KQW82579.1 polysaccharide biosynthesis protein GumN [Brevundimonas sp. Root1279]